MSQAVWRGKDRVNWSHPTLGEVEEVVCPGHWRVLGQALGDLGIGCAGSRVYDDAIPCDRCTEQDPPRVWLRRRFGRAQ